MGESLIFTTNISVLVSVFTCVTIIIFSTARQYSYFITWLMTNKDKVYCKSIYYRMYLFIVTYVDKEKMLIHLAGYEDVFVVLTYSEHSFSGGWMIKQNIFVS